MRLTSERVEWMEYRNLVTDNPHIASSIMTATARQQDALKREAGASVAGNKSDQVVFHYSLAWHPDEKDGLSKDEMLRAADQSIKALGADGHQAAIIAHNDTDHPHVHIVINRVNTENGKMLDLWNYQKKLSKWAMTYEQERGQVFCDKRVENWKRRDLGEVFSAEKDTAYHRHDQAKALGHANDNDTAKIVGEQKAKDSALAKDGEAMHLRHSKSWKNLSSWYAKGKAKIAGRKSTGSPTPFQKTAADVKAQFKPLRSQLGKQQWQETKDFERREKRILGKLENAVAAIKLSKSLVSEDGGEKTSLFNFLTSSVARKDALDMLHRSQWRNLNAGQSAEIGAAIVKVKKDQQKAYKTHRQRFNAKRNDLKAEQAEDKQTLRQKWQSRKAERSRVSKVISRMETIKKERKAAPEPSRGSERSEFNKAAKGKRKRRGRVRKRRVDD